MGPSYSASGLPSETVAITAAVLQLSRILLRALTPKARISRKDDGIMSCAKLNLAYILEEKTYGP